MSRTFRYGLLAAAAAQVLLLPAAASAQVEEIVVTARRIEERLQDVPTSITAVSGEELEQRQIAGFGDLGATVPNLNIQTQFGQPSTPQIFLRGVPTGLLKFQVDAGVGMYIDGVYLGRAVGAGFSIADLERLEVLRGPQGTLFGRNSTGGAINFVTKGPSGVAGGTVEATVGNYDQRRVRATLDTPDWGGLSAKITVVHNEHDGYVKNNGARRDFSVGHYGTVTSAKSFGLLDENSVLFAARYTGIDRLTVDYKFDWTDQDSTQLAVQAMGFDTDEGLAQGLVAAQGALGGRVPVSTRRLSSLPLDFNTEGNTRVMGHALTVQYELSDSLTLKNIASYRRMKQFSGGNDIDGGSWVDPFAGSGQPFCLLCSIADRKQNQISEEFQLLGKHERFSWIAGLFYFREHGQVDNSTFIFRTMPGGATGPIQAADYANGEFVHVRNKAKAAYGHLDVHLTDDLDFSGGVRYSEDTRWSRDFAPPYAAPGAGNKVDKVGFNSTDWDAAVTYAVQPGVKVYGKIATGYLSGGILSGIPFSPETITSYELGLKSELFDNRLRLNAAAFHTLREGVQVTNFVAGQGTFMLNAGNRKANGFEVEMVAAPVDGLTLNLGAGYTKTLLAAGVNVASPDANISAGAQYDFGHMGSGAFWSARLDGVWASKFSGITVPLSDRALEKSLEQGGVVNLSARLSLLDLPLGGAKARISAWGRNLTNEKKPEFVRDLGLMVVGSYQVPRTYGLDVGISF